MSGKIISSFFLLLCLATLTVAEIRDAKPNDFKGVRKHLFQDRPDLIKESKTPNRTRRSPERQGKCMGTLLYEK